MIDWHQNQRLLYDASDSAFRLFFSRHPVESICAVGYVFELWNASEQFDLCANTHKCFGETVETSESKWPDLHNEDEIRWNSGNFEFPARIGVEKNLDAWQSWKRESVRLHDLADQEPDSREIYDGLIKISCIVLSQLAKDGLFGDWSKIDFAVSEVGDEFQVVVQRDQLIRDMIKNGL